MREVIDAPVGKLAWLAGLYRESVRKAAAKGDIPEMPMVLSEEDTPDFRELGLPARNYNFLASGDLGDVSDRSRLLFSTVVALLRAGLPPEKAFSVAFHNPFCFEVALDHRRQDEQRAMEYLWRHHVCKAQPLAASQVLTAEDFESLEDEYEECDEDQRNSSVAAGADCDVRGAVRPTDPKNRFPIFQLGEYAAQPTLLEWLVPGVLPKAEICSIFGESGAGKSFFVLDLLVRLAAGMEWWGRPLPKRKVVYLAAEGAHGVRLRAKAMAVQFGVNLDEIDMHVIPAQPNLLLVEDVKDLIRAIKALGPVDVIVLDTIAQVTPGANENGSEDMGKALAHCKALHAALGATIVLVAHSGKNAKLGQRGWSGIKGAMDAQIEVTRTATYRAATVSKLKDGKGEGDRYMFKLHEVVVDFEADGSPISSCVVDPIISEAQKKAAEAAAKAQARESKCGRPKGSGRWGSIVIETLEDGCGPSNKPLHEERLLSAAVMRAQTHPDVNVRDPRNALRKALKALCDGEHSQVIHNATDDTYTLRVPPEPPSSPEC